jgi:hypothetical protein
MMTISRFELVGGVRQDKLYQAYRLISPKPIESEGATLVFGVRISSDRGMKSLL